MVGSLIVERNYLTKELSVPLGDSARPINADKVTVMWASLNNYTSLEPLSRIFTSLILNCDMIAWEERRKKLTAP